MGNSLLSLELGLCMLSTMLISGGFTVFKVQPHNDRYHTELIFNVLLLTTSLLLVRAVDEGTSCPCPRDGGKDMT